jgi:hypothetical protein
VLEDSPPATRPRWFCHWDGADASGFESVEEAVAWGLSRAISVIIRTLGGAFYFAGDRPSDWDDNDPELRDWPPAPAELQQIDADYEAAVAAANAEAAARSVYERERDEWLGMHFPSLAGRQPFHECLLLLPGEEDAYIEFEELDPAGTIAAAREAGGSRRAFGRPEEVITAVSGRPVDDPWVRAVCAALARERTWTHGGRRWMLLVKLGEGTMFHATAAANRDSIRRNGLDWQRMDAAFGIAGSQEPELPGIFLCATREDARFFTDMARAPSDIWQVRVDGLWLEGDPGASGGGDDIWMILPEPVGPDRLKLIDTDVMPTH